jgi:hypothetical protein
MNYPRLCEERGVSLKVYNLRSQMVLVTFVTLSNVPYMAYHNSSMSPSVIEFQLLVGEYNRMKQTYGLP